MKKGEKRMIIILIAVALMAIVMLKVFSNKKGEEQVAEKNLPSKQQEQIVRNTTGGGTEITTSEDFKKNKEESGFLISNINFREQNGETILTARITNNSGAQQEGFLGNIVLLDQSNHEIGKIPVRISETQNEETIEIEASITERYTNVYNFKLEK